MLKGELFQKLIKILEKYHFKDMLEILKLQIDLIKPGESPEIIKNENKIRQNWKV